MKILLRFFILLNILLVMLFTRITLDNNAFLHFILNYIFVLFFFISFNKNMFLICTIMLLLFGISKEFFDSTFTVFDILLNVFGICFGFITILINDKIETYINFNRLKVSR